jgi:hypothetical protein
VFFSFPEHLIQETIQCFKDENNIDLSVAEATEYLSSSSELFLVFADVSLDADDLRNEGDAPIVSSSS